MDCGIGNSHSGGVARINAVSTMGALQNHRSTELAFVDQFLDLLVATVITAHEANLYEVLAACHLGVNDFLALCSGVGQRLLREYRLASSEPDPCGKRPEW